MSVIVVEKQFFLFAFNRGVFDYGECGRHDDDEKQHHKKRDGELGYLNVEDSLFIVWNEHDGHFLMTFFNELLPLFTPDFFLYLIALGKRPFNLIFIYFILRFHTFPRGYAPCIIYRNEGALRQVFFRAIAAHVIISN